MSIDEPSKAALEVAKARQEVAKTTRATLPLFKQFGEWVGGLIGGSTEQGMGIIEDWLTYVRWERQQRFRVRAEQFMREQGLEGPSRSLPLKVAIPLLHEASLEEDDTLQDLWAKLLVNAINSESEVEVTRSFVSILRDFTLLEAKLLESIVNAPEQVFREGGFLYTNLLPDAYIGDPRFEDEPSGHVSIGLWNLVRLGCIMPVATLGGGSTVMEVAPTILGRALIAACTLQPVKPTFQP